MSTGFEHVTEKSLDGHAANSLAEEEVLNRTRSDAAEEGKEEEDFAKTHLAGRLLASDVIVQHHLGVILQLLYLLPISQTANFCKYILSKINSIEFFCLFVYLLIQKVIQTGL